MRVIFKKPGKEPEVKNIKNTLKTLQNAVKGYIEILPLIEDIVLICNEEGKLKGLSPNINWNRDEIVGNIVIASSCFGELKSLSDYELDIMMSALTADSNGSGGNKK